MQKKLTKQADYFAGSSGMSLFFFIYKFLNVCLFGPVNQVINNGRSYPQLTVLSRSAIAV